MGKDVVGIRINAFMMVWGGRVCRGGCVGEGV